MMNKEKIDFCRKWTVEALDRLEKLEKFYHEVGDLTFNHDVLAEDAVVYPSKLGKVLEKVDKEWWKKDK